MIPKHAQASPAAASAELPNLKIWTAGTLRYSTAGMVGLFCLLLWGDFAMSMKDRSVGPVFQVVLNKFGASDYLFALLCSSLPSVIGMILGPIVAYRSDRLRSKWGRRIPFVLIPTPFAALSMAGLGFSPVIGADLRHFLGTWSPELNTCILLTFGFFWVIFEVASVIANAVLGGLINDIVPQAVLGRFFGLFRAVSLVAGMVFNYYWMDEAKTIYLEIFLGMALLFGFGFGLMSLCLREGEYPPPPPPNSSSGVVGFLHAAKAFFNECYGIPYYRWYFAAATFAGMAFAPANLYNIPYAESLHVNYGYCMTLTFFVSLLMAYPLGWLVDCFHPLPIGFFTLYLYMLVTLWSGLYAVEAHAFSVALISHGVISGVYFTATASLGQRLFPKASFAQFAAAAGILANLATTLIPPLIGEYLDHAGHIYRYVYLMGSGFAAVGCVLLLVVYVKFLKLGGPKNYVAPS